MINKNNEEYNKIYEFHKWAICVFKIPNVEKGTHPLNWVTMAKFGYIAKECKKKKIKMAGLKPMIEAMKENLVGKKYKYTVLPSKIKFIGDLLKITQIDIDKNHFCPKYEGILCFKDDYFFIDGFNYESINLKYVWIIEEIK